MVSPWRCATPQVWAVAVTALLLQVFAASGGELPAPRIMGAGGVLRLRGGKTTRDPPGAPAQVAPRLGGYHADKYWQKRSRRKERAAQIADANRLRKLTKRHGLEAAQDRQATAPGAGEVLYAAQGEALHKQQARQDDPFMWLEQQLDLAESTGAAIPSMQDALRRLVPPTVGPEAEEPETSDVGTSSSAQADLGSEDKVRKAGDEAGWGGFVEGGNGRQNTRRGGVDGMEWDSDEEEGVSGRYQKQRIATKNSERARQHEEEVWDLRERKAARLPGKDRKKKEKLLKKLAEAEKLCDDGEWSRMELKSLSEHVSSELKLMDEASETRVQKVREEREAAAVQRRLKAAGLDTQTDPATAEGVLQAHDRYQQIDWEGLHDAEDGKGEGAAQTASARKKREKKRGLGQTDDGRTSRDGESGHGFRDGGSRVLDDDGSGNTAIVKTRTRGEQDEKSNRSQAFEAAVIRTSREQKRRRADSGRGGRADGDSEVPEGKERRTEMSRREEARERPAPRPRKQADSGNGEIGRATAPLQTKQAAAPQGQGAEPTGTHSDRSKPAQLPLWRLQIEADEDVEDGEEWPSENDGLPRELPTLDVLSAAYAEAQRRAQGQLRRREEITYADLVSEMQEAADIQLLKPSERLARQQEQLAAAAALSPAEEAAGGEAAWLEREGGLDMRAALAALRLHVRSDKAYARAVETLLVYATNVLLQPDAGAVRVVRSSNALFASRLGGYKGGLRCMFALGFRPVTCPGPAGPSLDPLHDSYLAMFEVPKDLAQMQVTLQQAFNKVAGSKGFSVIALREHEARQVCQGDAPAKLAFVQALVTSEAARATSRAPASASHTPHNPGANKGLEGGARVALCKAIVSAQVGPQHMAPAFSRDLCNTSASVAAGLDGGGRTLDAYLKELFPEWARQLCDPEASALLPEAQDVGIGLELAIARPDLLHPDRREVRADEKEGGREGGREGERERE